jgi:hypothetical protein
MMIRLVEDVGAPAVVALADIITLETKPEWNEYVAYILTGIGYAGAAFFKFGGDFVKNLGVASLPLTARNIYTRVKAGTPTAARASQRVALHAVSRSAGHVGRMYQTEFEESGSHAF